MTSKLRLARDVVMHHFDKGVKISIKILYVTDVVCELPLGLVRRAKEKRIRRKWGQPVGLLFWAKRASIEGFIHPNSTEDLESDNSNPKEVEGRAKLGS